MSDQRTIGKLRMPPPPLGSLAIQAPVPTQTVHVTASTCHNVSLFKGLSCGYCAQATVLSTYSEQIS
jgi:hypothetical protein